MTSRKRQSLDVLGSCAGMSETVKGDSEREDMGASASQTSAVENQPFSKLVLKD
jgi:hypothetical protein